MANRNGAHFWQDWEYTLLDTQTSNERVSKLTHRSIQAIATKRRRLKRAKETLARRIMHNG